ncbi:MAG: hypothetical protein ABI174_00970 [Chitinophagaceae bacterium]
MRKLSDADHSYMMGKLGIATLRPGASGSSNPNVPNAANYDESKANPFPGLPDPLKLKNGDVVKTPATWWGKRRAEILEDFNREIYGRMPVLIPSVRWEVLETRTDTVGGIPAITKKLIGHVDNTSYPQVTVDIQLSLTVPLSSRKPVPVIMELGYAVPAVVRSVTAVMGATPVVHPTTAAMGAIPGVHPTTAAKDTVAILVSAPLPVDASWQQQVLEKGWGYAILVPVSVQADNGAGLRSGIIGLVNKGEPRKPDDWGALRAWAWGASRALDYFETDKSVNARAVGIEGHSRYGKAAAVAMAYDQRFAIAFVSSSGEGGVKLHRRNAGELVENLAATGEYHWMAGNFMKYAGPLQWSDLPVDSHELLALCAPRPVFVSAGDRGDAWVDARGMFMACVHAGPVYKLLGKKDLGTTEFPAVETGLLNGEIAFRQHSGGHTPAPNWPTFIQFASRYLDVGRK